MEIYKNGNDLVYLKDEEGYIVLSTGLSVPADDTAGYAKGSLFVDTDVEKGTTGLYVNIGTKEECEFKAVSNAD